MPFTMCVCACVYGFKIITFFASIISYSYSISLTQSVIIIFIHIFNSRIFNWFAFVLIFYNGLAGVLAAVLRGLLSIAFSLLLFIRLDRIILMKGFERFDKGRMGNINVKFFVHCCGM